MPNVVIKVSPGFAVAVSSPGSREGAALRDAVRSYGGELGPPTGASGEPSEYFPVTGLAPERVHEFVEDLRRREGVEAVFVKPPDELP
jgi:hypothetical protein